MHTISMFALLWKVTYNNDPRQVNTSFIVLLIVFVYTAYVPPSMSTSNEPRKLTEWV